VRAGDDQGDQVSAAAIVADVLGKRRAKRCPSRRGCPGETVDYITFGHYGDRIGRKTMLILTLFMMEVATPS
jgi:MFS family permease